MVGYRHRKNNFHRRQQALLLLTYLNVFVAICYSRYRQLWFSANFFIFLFLSSLCAAQDNSSSSFTSSAPNFVFKHILPEQVASIGYINAIAQSKLGYMWFAGANGLARYDGYSLKIFRAQEANVKSLSDNYVNDLLAMDSGDMWVATRRGLNIYYPQTQSFLRKLAPESFVNSGAINDVQSIVQADAEHLWLATRAGLFKFDISTGDYVYYENPQLLGSSASKLIWSIVKDKSGYLWLGYQASGIFRFDPSTQEFTSIPIESSSAGVDVHQLYVDSENKIWAGTNGNGLYVFNSGEGSFKPLVHTTSSKSEAVWAILEDAERNIWIGDGNAVHVRPQSQRDFFSYAFDDTEPNSPGNFVVNKLFEDSAGNVWVGYFPSGIDIVDRQASVFKNYRHKSFGRNSVNNGGVLSVVKDGEDKLWIGCGYGLSHFNIKSKKFTELAIKEVTKENIFDGTVLSLAKKGNDLWLGVWSDGLKHLDLEKNILTSLPFTTIADVAIDNPVQHHAGDNKLSRLLGQEPWSIILGDGSQLWVGSELALTNFNTEANKFTAYIPPAQLLDGDTNFYTRTLYRDSKQRLWVGGMRGLFLFDPHQQSFSRFEHRSLDSSSLSANFVLSIYEDKRGQLWVGTDGGGVNLVDVDAGTFSAISTREGLADDVVSSIAEDLDGNLWLGTQKGLSQINSKSHEVRNFDKRHGLSDNLFNRNAAVQLADGELFFGHSKGFVIFDPKKLVGNKFVPPVVLTDLYVFNKAVIVGAEESLLPKSLNFTSQLNLTYRDSVFSIEFSALNFSMAEENHYKYRLLGFDEKWIDAGISRLATYTNLSAGNYVFEVMGSNNDGLWNLEPTRLKIHIAPPWWQTSWAYSLYILFFALMFYLIYRGQQQRFIYEQRKVDQERALVKRLQEVDKLKDDFLANTSHELLTPLNGIIGLAESLVESSAAELSQKSKQSIQLIAMSGKRLAILVKDILDFSKLKNHSMSFSKKAVDLKAVVELALLLTRPLVGSKPIVLINEVASNLPAIYADEDRLMQIFHNLLGNSVKFTDQGSIKVSAVQDGNYISVVVADTGIGIAREKYRDIFEAFRQVESDAERNYGGTGLGLSITKQLVELHGGKIWLESTQGKGTKFYFTLPLSLSIPKVLKPSLNYSVVSNNADFIPEPAVGENDHHAQVAAASHILVVDDDAVNRQVLNNYLSVHNYRVSEAVSGEDAIVFVESHQDIDMILLDVMMPKLSGFETCRRLRGRFKPHELPIIFMTARTQMDDIVAGFEMGANDYLTKPVAREELLARVAMHLELHRANRDLDKEVAERTEALRLKNEGLREAQLALQNAYQKLEQASLTDPLTNLHNRRFFTQSIGVDISLTDREYSHWAKSLQGDDEGRELVAPPSGHDLIFILLDIDFFKEVNDEFGHDAGDKLLQQLSRLLETVLRESDYLIRWGGEEFLILARFCNRSEAAEMAERILKAVEANRFDLGAGVFIKKTCSIGYAVYPFYPEVPNAMTWEQVVNTADKALYVAKKSGRNCWVGIHNNHQDQGQVNPALARNIASLYVAGVIGVSSSKPQDKLELDW